ncbi:MAG: hypothetical protein Q8J69_12800 [Sphingobacteriaceae bacterium]|nr:hypothetical protein [Sphingobacteriaceae bacterium]
MKLRIFLFSICLWAAFTAKAQEDQLKQQVFLSAGILDFSYLENFFGSDGSSYGLPGLGLLEYRLSANRLGVGVSVFSRQLEQERWTQSRSHRFFCILPHFDYYWVNDEKYQVSSQLALGFRFGETTTTDNFNAYFVSLYRRPAFQIIPLSVTFGSGRWLGRFEVGMGHKGFGTLGIGLQL